MSRTKRTGYDITKATSQGVDSIDVSDVNPLAEAFPVSAPPDDLDEYETSSTHIDEDNIRREFVRVSADVAFFGRRFAVAHRTWLARKRLKEETRAAVYLEMRETLEALESKKPTEATIAARVETHIGVRQVEADVIEAEYDREVAKSTVAAVMAKRDMLISLGAVMRAEMAPTSLRDTFITKDGE